MVHPLLVVNEDLLERINSDELHGKKVSVSGKYYPATGLILVTGVTPAG